MENYIVNGYELTEGQYTAYIQMMRYGVQINTDSKQTWISNVEGNIEIKYLPHGLLLDAFIQCREYRIVSEIIKH